MKRIIQLAFSALQASPFWTAVAAASLAALSALTPAGAEARSIDNRFPTVVLVHGAFADASSWNAVSGRLLRKGYGVVAVANPLRGLASDADYVGRLLDSIPGPVVLVGHSYGGSVITVAATGHANVKALVYVAALIPDVGESVAALSGQYPGSTLASALAPPVMLSDGNKDLYIEQSKFRAQFAADVPARTARLMAAHQRPVTEAALNEPATSAAWKTIPSWSLFGSLDMNVPGAAQLFMAKRAGSQVVEVSGASHVVMVSNPGQLVRMIRAAAANASR